MKPKAKNKRKYVIVSQKLYPSQIDELSICCFLVKKERLDDTLSFIVNNGGRVISAVACSGISKKTIIESINGFEQNCYFIFAECQKEITEVFMQTICKELEFYKRGQGKAFVLDVLGYMGAKGPFVE